MTTAEQNYLLLQEIEANRRFLLMAYQQNPKLLKNAEARIKQLFEVTASCEPNGHGKYAAPDDETSHARFPHPNPLPVGEGANESLRESHVNEVNPAGMRKQRGISLIELIMFIVIISIAVTGILLVMNKVTGHSADSLIRKQALAAAESLLEEIELQDFISASGVTPAVTQANRATAYHIVSDYSGFTTTGIFPVSGVTAVPDLEGYNVNPAVTVVQAGGDLGVAAASAVRITVSVTDPVGQRIDVTGYRTAY